MQPRIPLTLTTRACCCWFMPSLVFSRTHRSFSIKLLSHWVVSSMSSCLHFSLTRCRIWHFSFLNSCGAISAAHWGPSGWTDNPLAHQWLPSKLAEGTLCPIIPGVNEGLHRAGLHVWPLGAISGCCPPSRLHTTDHQPLVPATQPGLKPNPCLLIQHLKQQLLSEDFKWDCDKGLPEVQADNIYCQSRQTMSISNALEMRFSVLG